MKRIITLIIVLVIVQLSCYAPTQSYPEIVATPIEVSSPSIFRRGENNTISIEVEPDAICYVGISYWDDSDNWITVELPLIIADEKSFCKWVWNVPNNAKNGIASIRGYIETENGEYNIFPREFCIEECP